MAVEASTLVLTPQGWRQARALRVGDLVLDESGRERVVDRADGRLDEVVRVILNDGSAVECSPNQLWPVRTKMDTWRGKGFRVLSLDTALEKGLEMGGGCRWFVPGLSQLAWSPGRDLMRPLHPYLLGVYLGDGSSRAGNGSPSLTNEDPCVLGVAQALLPPGVSLVQARDRPLTYNITSGRYGRRVNRMSNYLDELGLRRLKSELKFIPDCYLWASAADRLWLIKGLCDTDGTVEEDSTTVEFSTSSPKLAQGMRHLVESLGGTANTTSRVPTYTHHGELRQGLDSYRVWIRLPAPLNPFHTLRKHRRYVPPSKYPPRRAIEVVLPGGQGRVIDLRLQEGRTFVVRHFLVAHTDGDWQPARYAGAERLKIEPLPPPDALL